MFFKLVFITFINLIIQFNIINCFYAKANYESNVLCGIRYNDRSSLNLNENLFEMVDGKSIIKTRALDDTPHGNETAKTTMVISRQKQSLTKLLGRISKLTPLLDDKTKSDFDKLIIESKSFVPKNKLETIEKSVSQSNNKVTRNTDNKVELEAMDLMQKARLLIGKIDKNMKVKTRIIGGSIASIREFPWICSLQNEDGGHLCGCSILSPYWVITASHCITNKETNNVTTSKFNVGIGSSFWQKSLKHKVDKIFKHVGFTFDMFRNDVALLRLSVPITLKKGRIVPICLPPKNSEVFGAGTLAGWGVTENESTTPSDTLMRVNIEILKDNICQKVYPNFNNREMICAGKYSGGKDSCQGDSGGPLQSILSNNRVYLVGITSFGDRCGREHFPGVYTKISTHIDWIYGIIEKYSPKIDTHSTVTKYKK